MGAGPDNEPLASPGNFFPGRKRRVAELFAELLGRSFLPLPHFAAFDHHIMRVALSLNLDLAKFDQSCFHISMFRWLEFQGKRQDSKASRSAQAVDLTSDVLPFGRLWYAESNASANAIGYAKFYSRSHRAVIRVYDQAGNVIETHEHVGDFKKW
jgi:hypothetical protein